MPEIAAGVAIGLDLGSSGVRAALVDASGDAVGFVSASISAADRRLPSVWWRSVQEAIGALHAQADLSGVRAIALDGTSGTVLPVDAAGQPLARASLYNARAEAPCIAEVAAVAAADSAARGATSPLARLLEWRNLPGLAWVLHEADWLTGQLCGVLGTTDANNALKTGYDPRIGGWPDWVRDLVRHPCLPRVVAAGEALGRILPDIAVLLGLPLATTVVAGTTDGCAAFLATGAGQTGDAVTSLGTTLTLKVMSDTPVFCPRYGIYSHLMHGRWLAGGASNSGGAALRRHFEPADLARLSRRIDSATDSPLDYYPLPGAGERFPVADGAMKPRETPRPVDDVAFLHGLLQGITRIEALGYRRLAELGAPLPRSVRTVGGGAGNAVWTAIRAPAGPAAGAVALGGGGGRHRRPGAGGGGAMRHARHLLDLRDRADVLLVDQFGTLHDGTTAYPGAIDTLVAVRAAGVRIALLSNSGKRVSRNTLRLAGLGIEASCYDLSLTSGELGWRMLRDGALPAARGATRALLLARGGDLLLGGTGIEQVGDVARAQLVVIAGSEGDLRSMDAYEAMLEPAARLGLPAVCLNPDRLMLTPTGLHFGAGRIAETYQALGGEVTWIGKPYADVYGAVLAALGDPDPARVAGVGDSIEHDIAGAQRAGGQGWLVRTGIIQGASDAQIEAEIERFGARPDVVLPAFL